MSTNRKAARSARKPNGPAPRATVASKDPSLAVGAEMLLINQAIVTHRVRNEAHILLDKFETDIRASEQATTDFLAAAPSYCKALVRGWHDRSCETIRDGNMTLGLTMHSVGTTVVHDRLYVLERDLRAERASRPDEATAPEAIVDA